MASSSASSSSLPSSLSLPQVKKDEVSINWAELPPELTSSIMLRLNVIERLESAQRVCTSWLRACKDPSIWRIIDMRNLGSKKTLYGVRNLGRYDDYKLKALCRRAVYLSQGGLLEIKIEEFGSDSLLAYIAARSSSMRSLEVIDCDEITSFGISKAVKKLSLLEKLSVSFDSIEDHDLKAIGQACSNLKTLKLNYMGHRPPRLVCDDDALAIAETMPGLRHLELFGNRLSDLGLNAILDKCPHLEHLDLRRCIFVNLVGDMEERCFQRIKVVKRPDDSTADYPFYFISFVADHGDYDYDSDYYAYESDDDYPYGLDDYDSCKRSI